VRAMHAVRTIKKIVQRKLEQPLDRRTPCDGPCGKVRFGGFDRD
jgi:hypothetical protein